MSDSNFTQILTSPDARRLGIINHIEIVVHHKVIMFHIEDVFKNHDLIHTNKLLLLGETAKKAYNLAKEPLFKLSFWQGIKYFSVKEGGGKLALTKLNLKRGKWVTASF